ncbi:MAG: hypothetical protein VW686_11950 [Luminiphilus sp.]
MKHLKAVLITLMMSTFILSSAPARAQNDSTTMAAGGLMVEEKSDGLRYLAIGAGAVAGVALLNLVTGGMAMVPIIGAGMDTGLAMGVAADGGLGAAVRVSTRWAATALAAVGGGIAGNALYD